MTGGRELRHPLVTELQYYRDRAAGMLSVLGTGERNAIALVRLFHPDFASASEADAVTCRGCMGRQLGLCTTAAGAWRGPQHQGRRA
jgi:hypothetical protein